MSRRHCDGGELCEHGDSSESRFPKAGKPAFGISRPSSALSTGQEPSEVDHHVRGVDLQVTPVEKTASTEFPYPPRNPVCQALHSHAVRSIASKTWGEKRSQPGNLGSATRLVGRRFSPRPCSSLRELTCQSLPQIAFPQSATTQFERWPHLRVGASGGTHLAPDSAPLNSRVEWKGRADQEERQAGLRRVTLGASPRATRPDVLGVS